ncbi:MAG: winged helix-turn-helix transcriptional regulator [Caldimicrobium sp.]|jgi:transposase
MRKRSRVITMDDVRFVYENYAKMSASEIAEKLGISKFQVNKIVNELRKRGVEIPKKIGKKINVYDAFVEELKKKGNI